MTNTNHPFLKTVKKLVKIDLKIERKNHTNTNIVIVFIFIMSFMFGMFFNGFYISIEPEIFMSLIYISIIVIASSMILSSIFLYEKETGVMDIITIMPIPKDLIFISKIITNLLFLFVANIATVIFLMLFINVEISYYVLNLFIAITFLLPAFSIIGTFVSSILFSKTKQDVLYSIIMIPLTIPILMSATTIIPNLSGTSFLNVFNFWFIFLYTALLFFISTYIFEKTT